MQADVILKDPLVGGGGGSYAPSADGFSGVKYKI